MINLLYKDEKPITPGTYYRPSKTQYEFWDYSWIHKEFKMVCYIDYETYHKIYNSKMQGALCG